MCFDETETEHVFAWTIAFLHFSKTGVPNPEDFVAKVSILGNELPVKIEKNDSSVMIVIV